MSCGDPHETDCREVLAEVYLYLDLESASGRREVIQRHLDECSPCLREYGIEQEVKALVGRCCGAETAPVDLRDRLRRKLADLVASGGVREAGVRETGVRETGVREPRPD
jgi:mycothiol system anti-sigma-R factor